MLLDVAVKVQAELRIAIAVGLLFEVFFPKTLSGDMRTLQFIGIVL